MPKDARRPKDIALDRKIGAALAFIRKRDAQQTQAQFAMRLGVSRGHLANIESGRVPLTASVAWNTCKILNLDPRWLCNAGNYPTTVFPEIEPDNLVRLESLMAAVPNAPFRAVWPPVSSLVGPDAPNTAFPLDEVTLKSNMPPVQPEVSKLMRRLEDATKIPGTKAKLARLLDVAPSRISEWLSGTKEPGGEYTLKLLRWIEKYEHDKQRSIQNKQKAENL